MLTFPDLLQVSCDEAARLRATLSCVEGTGWTTPVGVRRWDLATTLAHMAWEAAAYTESVDRGLQGDYSPWPGFPPAGASALAPIDELIDLRARESNHELGHALLSTFLERDDRLFHLLSLLKSEEQRQRLCYHPIELLPASRFAFLRIQESAIHGWDIQRALGAPAQLSDGAVAALSDHLGSRIRLVFSRAAQLSRIVHLRLQSRGEAGRTFDVTMGDGAVRIEETTNGTPDVTIEGAPESLILWLYGRVPLRNAIASGDALLRGNQGIAKALLG